MSESDRDRVTQRSRQQMLAAEANGITQSLKIKYILNNILFSEQHCNLRAPGYVTVEIISCLSYFPVYPYCKYLSAEVTQAYLFSSNMKGPN